jgi:signal transduction histidine kinase
VGASTNPGSSARVPRSASPGVRVVQVALLAVVLMWAAGALTVWLGYRSDAEREAARYQSVSRAAAAVIDGFLRDRADLLEAVAAAPEVRSADPARVGPYLAAVAAGQPLLARAVWVDAGGTIRASTDPAVVGVSVAQRDYFRGVLATGAPFVGSAGVARGGTRPGLGVAAPTRDAEDWLTGVLSVGIALDQLDAALHEVEAIAGGTLLVVDRADQLVVGGAWQNGTPPSVDAGLLSRARAERTGVLRGVGGLRGEPDRMVAFADAPAGGWIVLIERPLADALAEARWRALTALGRLAAVALLALAGAAAVARRLNRLHADEVRARAETQALAAENARLYEQSRAAVRTRDEFIAVAAHELRTPITGLRGFVQLALFRLARQESPDAARAAEALHQAEALTGRLAHLVGQLLSVARLEAGKLALAPEQTDLVRLVEDAAAEAGAAHGDRMIVVRAPEPVAAAVDPLRVGQVVANLLDNALKFSPPGSPVEIEVRRDGAGAAIAVRDHGPGIPPELRAQVFERFHQGGDGRKHAGLGLGLYVSRQIAEAHGGSLDVEAPEGGGTRAVLRLPAPVGAAAAPAPSILDT